MAPSSNSKARRTDAYSAPLDSNLRIDPVGAKYKIIQPHTSQSDWLPPNTPALSGRVPDGEHHEQQQQQQQPTPPQYSYGGQQGMPIPIPTLARDVSSSWDYAQAATPIKSRTSRTPTRKSISRTRSTRRNGGTSAMSARSSLRCVCRACASDDHTPPPTAADASCAAWRWALSRRRHPRRRLPRVPRAREERRRGNTWLSYSFPTCC